MDDRLILLLLSLDEEVNNLLLQRNFYECGYILKPGADSIFIGLLFMERAGSICAFNISSRPAICEPWEGVGWVLLPFLGEDISAAGKAREARLELEPCVARSLVCTPYSRGMLFPRGGSAPPDPLQN